MKKDKTRVLYAKAVYGKEEEKAVSHLLSSGKFLAGGEYTPIFEKKIASIFGKKYGVMVNSGSSANLIATELLNLSPGSEIITPILTFGTTIAPLVQKGLVPVFIDVQEGTYVIDAEKIERMIGKKTKAMIIPYLMGNIPDLDLLHKISKKYGLIFIEDSCDTIGATYRSKPTGHYSDISTTSFYASHIITAGGTGGMVMFDKPKWYDRARMFRGWGRSSSAFSESEDIKKRFSAKINKMPYDAKFIFKEIGYNFIPQEIGATFGLEQIKKLPAFSKNRNDNFAELFNFFSNHQKYFILPKQRKEAKTNWLAFPLTLREKTLFSRTDLTIFLEKKGIQTRPVFTGNILKHGAYKKIKRRVCKSGYPETDKVMERAFVIGCHHGMERKEMTHIKNIFTEFLSKYK